MSLSDASRTHWSALAVLAASCLAVPSFARAEQTGAPPYEGTVKPAPAPIPTAGNEASKTDVSKQDAGGTSTKAESNSLADRAQADREAFFDARIAALHAGLTLNPDQESIWAPVESAIRDFAKTSGGRRSREQVSSLLREAPSSLVRMRSEQLIHRGEAMKKLVDATAPLMDKLSDAQKNRLPVLLQGLHPSRILRAAFDIRYGAVVDDSDDDNGPKSSQTQRDNVGDEGSSYHHERMRDDDSGYDASRGNPISRRGQGDRNDDDRD